MDIIFIEQLTVMAFIGVYDWEQQYLQKLVFDLELGWDNLPAARSDNISDSLSYTDVSETVLSLVSSNCFTLIERVAEEVAELLITKFSLTWVRIKVTKPGAVPQAASVGVIIQRGQKK
ncbi:dihydroneopterin aldolase [Candidatus Palibaumannia cicadellinicola]|uniref:7,8-dihydroneopterin aldolase n=1 Tax=Candidatus Palibaumannia cicadellinicola TaxID=186490 RepID=A0A088MZ90_9GAMM|nr:dihydroneopterin aldolase [Candidatus Baumannia cicadellinicola]AIN47539.1 Dihydroneopterin aldolase [Candidatus Baumannia cicadellinicola]